MLKRWCLTCLALSATAYRVDENRQENVSVIAPFAAPDTWSAQSAAEFLKMGLEACVMIMETARSHGVVEVTQIAVEHTWQMALYIQSASGDVLPPEAQTSWESKFNELSSNEELTTNIQSYATTSDPKYILTTIDTYFGVAGDLTAEFFPAYAKYFDQAKAMGHAAVDVPVAATSPPGDVTDTIEKLYEVLASAVDTFLPEEHRSSDTYKVVMEVLDFTLGNISKIALEFRTAILTSKVCYRQSYQREPSNVDTCDVGYEYDGGVRCVAPLEKGRDCWESCGKVPGTCDGFCGVGKACCKRFDENTPCECRNAVFYDDDKNIGSSSEYYQCVNVGNMVEANTPTSLGQMGSRLDQALANKPPKERKCKMSSGSLMDKVDKTVAKKTAGSTQSWGTVMATCSKDLEACGQQMCAAHCKTGYVAKSCSCVALCSGKFPAYKEEMTDMCGTTAGDLTQWIIQVSIQGFISSKAIAFSAISIHKNGVNAGSFKSIIRALIDFAKNFANPTCPAPAE